jgi:hypothetical protein
VQTKEAIVILKMGPRVSVVAIMLTIGLTACQQPTARQADSSVETAEADARPAATETKSDPRARNRGDQTPFKSSGKIAFPETEHDFGEVEEGESLTYVFKIRNDHNEEVLHIKRVRGS